MAVKAPAISGGAGGGDVIELTTKGLLLSKLTVGSSIKDTEINILGAGSCYVYSVPYTYGAQEQQTLVLSQDILDTLVIGKTYTMQIYSEGTEIVNLTFDYSTDPFGGTYIRNVTINNFIVPNSMKYDNVVLS